MRIIIDLSLIGVRCWYPLTGLHVRIYDMCIYDTVLWPIICMCFWMILRFDYICNKWLIICLENYIWYHWVNSWNQNTRALLDSILLCIVYNCLLDIWFTPSITIFRLKFRWETKSLNHFIRCKVEHGSFWTTSIMLEALKDF